MNIFECLNYRAWFEIWLKSLPKEGHGELSRIAHHLKVNSTLISQVLSGNREFSVEQGHALTQYFALNGLETRYFMLMLQYERAGSPGLKDYFRKELKQVKSEAGLIVNRLEVDTEISDADRSFLVGNWKPTALLVYCGKSGGVRLEDVVKEFQISSDSALKILERLAEMGLVIQKESRFETGFKRLHIPKGSSFLLRHYANWRLRAIDRSDELQEDEVMFTSVSSISDSEIPALKEKILTWVSTYAKAVTASPAEKSVCLNLDFFRV
jgi:hypothetical protein